jgi:hypothetical protein
MRTYGTLRHGKDARERAVWGITCEPHVMIRLKRWFAKVRTDRAGMAILSDTLDVARDLDAFIARFPLDAPATAIAHLEQRVRESLDREKAILEVVDGRVRLEYPEDREPSRPLWDFQAQARDFGWTAKRFFLFDAVGLGKTTSALSLFMRPECLPAVFVTLTRPLPEQMMGEAAKVFPWLTGFVPLRGQFYDPTELRGRNRMDEWPDVTYLSYSKLAGWAHPLAERGIKTVIFDEVQELRHEGTVKYASAGQLADAAEYVAGLTATPVYNYGGEMFSLVQIVAPDFLGTWEEFSREWGAGRGSSGGGQSGMKVGDPLGLGSFLREQGIVLGRTRKDVGKELPPTQLIEHLVDADTKALDAISEEIADLASLILDVATDRRTRYTASGEIDWRLRQSTGIAKAPYVAQFIRLLLDSEEKVLVYAWHRSVYDILMAHLRQFRPVMFTGSESPAQKQAAKDQFMKPNDEGGSAVLLMSLRSGAGLDGLQDVCSVVVFAELDWSPQRHHQAVGRVDRVRSDGVQNQVAAYFLHTEDGSDPVLMEVLGVKRMQNDPLVDPDAEQVERTGDGEDRVRRLAAAALRRAGRPVPMALEGPHAPTPEEAAAAFADVPVPVPEGQEALW